MASSSNSECLEPVFRSSGRNSRLCVGASLSGVLEAWGEAERSGPSGDEAESRAGGTPVDAPLSVAHNSPLVESVGAVVRIARGGNACRLYVPGVKGGKGASGALRSAVVSYTRQSAARLRFLVNCVCEDGQAPPWLVTLTYPDEFESARGSKKHLDTFAKAFAREYPSGSFVWKLEPQKRGAPHFHLLVFGASPDVRWVASTWNAIAAAGQPLHLSWHLGQLGRGNRPCVEQASSWGRVNAYLSKYMTKLVGGDEWHEPGRFWGVVGRENLARLINVESISISHLAAMKLQRVMRKRSESKTRGRFLVVGPDLHRPVDVAWVRSHMGDVSEKSGDFVVPRDSLAFHLARELPADLSSLAARKWVRGYLAHYFDGRLRLVWAGRSRGSSGRSCRTMYVRENVSRRLLAWAMKATADTQVRNTARADARKLQYIEKLCDLSEKAGVLGGFGEAMRSAERWNRATAYPDRVNSLRPLRRPEMTPVLWGVL